MKRFMVVAFVLAAPAAAQIDKGISDQIMSADRAAVQDLYMQALRQMGCTVDNNDIAQRVAFGDLLIEGVFDLVDMPAAHRQDRDVRNTALMPTDDAALALTSDGRVVSGPTPGVLTLANCP